MDGRAPGRSHGRQVSRAPRALSKGGAAGTALAGGTPSSRTPSPRRRTTATPRRRGSAVAVTVRAVTTSRSTTPAARLVRLGFRDAARAERLIADPALAGLAAPVAQGC